MSLTKKYEEAKKQYLRADKDLNNYIKKLLAIWVTFKRAHYSYNFEEEYILTNYDDFLSFYNVFDKIMRIEIQTYCLGSHGKYTISFPYELFDGSILDDNQIKEIMISYIIKTDKDIK